MTHDNEKNTTCYNSLGICGLDCPTLCRRPLPCVRLSVHPWKWQCYQKPCNHGNNKNHRLSQSGGSLPSQFLARVSTRRCPTLCHYPLLPLPFFLAWKKNVSKFNYSRKKTETPHATKVWEFCAQSAFAAMVSCLRCPTLCRHPPSTCHHSFQLFFTYETQKFVYSWEKCKSTALKLPNSQSLGFLCQVSIFIQMHCFIWKTGIIIIPRLLCFLCGLVA